MMILLDGGHQRAAVARSAPHGKAHSTWSIRYGMRFLVTSRPQNAYCSFFGVTFRSPSVYRSISHRCVPACGTGADGAHDRVHTGDFAVLGL